MNVQPLICYLHKQMEFFPAVNFFFRLDFTRVFFTEESGEAF